MKPVTDSKFHIPDNYGWKTQQGVLVRARSNKIINSSASTLVLRINT
ncbi:hypothetical protein JCM19240_807 [Vibrio maritimus]|uniref:Uncharacterized protein n=1 Tax=Vibrio maritimus TaxID=990268 RepID=A0A090T566_9VIBR|nr:hypothetical protein JCM19240_807 [Vibrio maritimus]